LAEPCTFLGLDPSPDYLESSAGVVKTKPNQSRTTLTWEQAELDLVREKMSRYPWFGYYQE